MREIPILFSGPMVRALLAGTKTQTRRVVTNPHRSDGGFVLQDYGNGWWPYRSHDGESGCYLDRQKDGDYYSEAPLRCPYGKPGDRLWVREAWARTTVFPGTELVVYRESDNRTDYGGPWKPGIHMFRRDSRITLEVTGVRVERLQDISEVDAIAEGLTQAANGSWLPGPCDYPEWAYHQLWEQINGPGSWDANPWVWVIEFKRVAP